MFCRIATCGIVAFFMAMLALSNGATDASVDPAMPSPAGAPTLTHEQTQDQARQHPQASAYQGVQPSAKVTALDSEQATALLPTTFATRQSLEVEPFGLRTITISAGPFVTMWNSIRANIRAESEILMRCRESSEHCPAAAQTFLGIIADSRAHVGRARIGVINRAINLMIRPTSENHWTAPLETFAIGDGNCKQYAVAKYAALIEAGINEDDVKLVIVHDRAADENHAVVATRLDGTWIVLDNRWLALVQDIEVRGVIPLFVLDRHGVKQFLPTPKLGLS